MYRCMYRRAISSINQLAHVNVCFCMRTQDTCALQQRSHRRKVRWPLQQPLQRAQAAGCRRWRALLGSKPLAHGPAPSTRLCDGWSKRLSSADVRSPCSSISRMCSAAALQEHQRRPSAQHVAETVCAAHVRRLKD